MTKIILIIGFFNGGYFYQPFDSIDTCEKQMAVLLKIQTKRVATATCVPDYAIISKPNGEILGYPTTHPDSPTQRNRDHGR